MRTPYRVKVVFRKFKDDGSIVALFPEELWNHIGDITSYMHVGQHGAADYCGVMACSVATTDQEHRALRQELESIGYVLDIRKKYVKPHKRLE